MVVCQGDVFWANLHSSKGSEPKDRRPVVVVQRDSINRSKFQTVVVVPSTFPTQKYYIFYPIIEHKLPNLHIIPLNNLRPFFLADFNILNLIHYLCAR